MKTNLLLLVLVLLLASCDLLKDDKKSDSSDSIGGTTDIPINTVGNTFSNSLFLGSSFVSGSIAITSVTGGVATVKILMPVPSSVPALQSIKPKYKDASGNLVCDAKFKMTDEGILDYNNLDHKPFVLVKYDAEVGDKYTLKKSDGKEIVREVVRKSTTDDYYWGAMLIKTIDVEQMSNTPGVSKIIYYTNHKFGLVGIKILMEDGTAPQLSLAPSKY